MAHEETTEKRMHQLEQKLRLMQTLIDQLPDYLYMKNTSHQFILANRAVAQSFGTDTPQDIIGKSDFDLHPSHLAEEFSAVEHDLMESGKPNLAREELTYDPDTGHEVWLSTSKVPIRDEDGQIMGLVGFAQDITAQKKAEAETRRKQEVIREQQEALLELSTPILPIFDRVLVMPLIGNIDSQRASNIMRALLEGVSLHRAKIIILDVTGVPLIDSGVADYLNRTIQAARLKGAVTILTGISDSVAETIVDLGLGWSDIRTMRDLQSGLMLALELRGIQLQEV